MSNIGQFNNKNPQWGRANNSPNIVNQPNLQQQLINQSALNNMNTSGLVQFQQQHPQVFQNAMGLQQQNLGLGLQQMAGGALGSSQLFQQVGAVSYPNPRGLNPTAFQAPAAAVPPVQAGGAKQRVFTGTVTKMLDNFGFVDEDVFFQTNVCVKGSSPVIGDRVLVEASYNPSMPFKWNATRIQVLPMSNQPPQRHAAKGGYGGGGAGNAYNAVPPPAESGSNGGFGGRGGQRMKPALGRRERSRERERDDDEVERKRRREERMREREKEEKKSPLRRRSRSPKSRRRSRIVPRYMVQIPKIALDLPKADVLEIRRRYSNLYIPSDFFFTHFRWVDAFPPDKPFTMNKPCSFHIMNKEVDSVIENNATLEPSDADYIYSAKVMLMNMSGLDELYQKCCAMAEDKDKRDRESEERDFVHPARLLNFLVGLRGKNETMAIGGAWSASMDGENPDRDPSVLIRTAIRTCKALTGIDLSSCTQWYRFVELYYRRSESTHKGRAVPARVETVVLFLPDVWSCVPTRLEWDGLHQSYRRQLERRLNAEQEGEAAAGGDADDDNPPIDEKEEEALVDKVEPTHYSQLDPKAMVVSALRGELKARNINSKGLKSQLVARLVKVLKSEAEKSDDPMQEPMQEDIDTSVEEKKTEAEEKKLDEKEKALLEKRYTLPEQQQILVHPSRSAKSGKFDCTTMSLSLLLDYRPEDTKEHSFEVSLFAELFNEMLMRDFGFNIYRALFELPDKPKDEKKKRDDNEKKERRDDEKSKREDEKKDDSERKSDEVGRDEKSRKDDDGSTGSGSKKRDKKEQDKKSDESEEEDEYEDDESSKDKKKDKDKKKKERVKMYTKDKHLLLSFIYFDQTHCGYIFDKDIEDLLYTLGLNLSRAQVRKLVSKVVTRDSLHYRKLTDKPKENTELIVIDDGDKEAVLHDLAVGNKKLLPVFSSEERGGNREGQNCSTTPNCEDGLVLYRGALVDVGKLMIQLERSEKARVETEIRMVSLKTENTKLGEKSNKSNSTIKHLNSDLKEYREKLRSSEDSLSRITAFSKLYQATLVEIRDKIDPVLKSTSSIKEEQASAAKEEKKNEEVKSRWEKDVKHAEAGDVKVYDIKSE